MELQFVNTKERNTKTPMENSIHPLGPMRMESHASSLIFYETPNRSRVDENKAQPGA